MFQATVEKMALVPNLPVGFETSPLGGSGIWKILFLRPSAVLSHILTAKIHVLGKGSYWAEVYRDGVSCSVDICRSQPLIYRRSTFNKPKCVLGSHASSIGRVYTGHSGPEVDEVDFTGNAGGCLRLHLLSGRKASLQFMRPDSWTYIASSIMSR